MELVKRNGNKQSEYELFRRKFGTTISEYESELIELLKSVSTTYGDIDRELESIKRNAIFINDKILLEVIKSVKRHFESEKGSLPLK